MNNQPKPNRELDARVAKHVMGWQDVHFRDVPLPTGGYARPRLVGIHPRTGSDHDTTLRAIHRTIPHYSRRIASAFQVVHHLRSQGHTVDFFDNGTDFGWIVEVSTDDEKWIGPAKDSLPHAICLAALKAAKQEAPA